MYVLLEYIDCANTWLTVVLEMIVLLEYIDLLIIQGCKISGQAIARLAVAVPLALHYAIRGDSSTNFY